MANYSITVGSEFKPFSYQEMLAPVLMAQQAHEQIEDAYSDLETKASIWDKMANEQSDPVAYNTYKQYARDLEAQVQLFQSRGLTPSSRKSMLGLKSRYSKDISPIEQAYARRKELQDEQRKALLSNPTLMFQRNLNNAGYESSLDRFIENPQYDYGKSVSGATLTSQVQAQAANLAKEFRNDPDNLRRLVGGDYFEYIKSRGYSSEAILAAIQDNLDSSPVLKRIVDDVIGAAGVPQWADSQTLQQAYSYARQGLWSAVGQDESQILQNWRAQENLRHANDMAKLSVQQAFQAAENEKNRKADADKYRQVPVKNEQGETVGMYNPVIGMIVNPDGSIPADNPYKVGTQPRSNNSGTALSKQVANEVTGATIGDLAKATKKRDVEKLGFTPFMAVAHVSEGPGSYQWGKGGEDLGDDNNRLVIDEKTGQPITITDNNGNILGYKTQKGRIRKGGMTSSNVVSDWGNFTYEPDSHENYRYVSDKEFEALPFDVQASIQQAALESGEILPGEQYHIFAVKGQSGRGDSYILVK